MGMTVGEGTINYIVKISMKIVNSVDKRLDSDFVNLDMYEITKHS